MKNKMSNISRLLLISAAIGLALVLREPIWRIDLDAPQYPEGLTLKIFAHELGGDVAIINGLNHYIGMKTLHKEDFIEFTILPYCVLFFAAACLLVAVVNRRKMLHWLFILFVSFGIIAIIDFWRWEYNYGHNLDPNAAIIVPGMAYQPPLVGFKQLLNFGAYSVPDTGGWIFIGAGLLLLICVLFEWNRYRKMKKNSLMPLLLFSFLTLLLNGCKQGPEPVVPGKDNCYFCKMTITNASYAAELVSVKGKVHKFDDLHCLLTFIKSGMADQSQIQNIYAADFAGVHALVNIKEAFLLQGENIHGPMNGNAIAFASNDSLKKYGLQFSASPVKWDQLVK